MSNTMFTLRWSVIVNDTDRWPSELLCTLEDSGDADPHDWACNNLRAAMEGAGNEFIRANPDLFQGELV